MKIYIIITVLLFLIYSCSSDTKKEFTEKEKQSLNSELTDLQLSDQKEKIALLASIKNVPYDTLYLIIKDYYNMTSEYGFREDSIAIVSDKTIDSISKTYHFSKSKVASLVFSFKYEMQTKEDIINSFEQDAQDAQDARDQEEYDPLY